MLINFFGVPPLNELSHKQSSWDRPGLLLDRNVVESGLVEARQKASFLTASSQHRGDWLAVLPIASCGQRLDDEAVRVAVALRLGLNLSIRHACRCVSQIDARGLHAFVSKFAPGKFARHQAINDVISRAFASAHAGARYKRAYTSLSRSDGRRPDGINLIPWQNGKALTWDVITVAAILADAYISASARSAGAVAELAATRKITKCCNLPAAYMFQPIALETLGAINSSAGEFLADLGRKICVVSEKRLNNETLRVAVGLWLGSDLCQPYRCICGASCSRHSWLSCALVQTKPGSITAPSLCE